MGYIAPDQDPEAIRRELTAPAPPTQDISQDQLPLQDTSPAPPATPLQVAPSLENTLAEVDIAMPELQEYREELTPLQEQALMHGGDDTDLDATVIRGASPSPTQAPKSRRRVSSGGSAMSDPSDRLNH